MELNKKAQLNQKINTAVGIVITIVVLFLIFADLVPEAQSGGDRFSDATKCAEASCFSNTSLTPSCVINSSQEGTAACENDIQTVPLAGLFGGSGVVILLLMVFLFLMVLRVAFRRR